MKFLDHFLKGGADQSTEAVDAPPRKALVDLVLASLRRMPIPKPDSDC